MARIISQVNPQTGRRQKIAGIEGDFRERSESLGAAFGTSPGRASRMSNGKIANELAPGFASFSPISTKSLAPTPDFKLPPTPAPTAAAGLQGQLETQAKGTDTFLQDLSKTRQEREQAFASSGNDLMSFLANQEGKTARTANEYSKAGGVDTLEVELKDINQRMLEEQEALRKSVERIQTAPGTATAAERDREVRETERGSLRRQADLAIIQLSKQGRYDSAKAIADRAVAMQLEDQAQELQARQFIYQENKELFTKAEQREFETELSDRNRKLEMEEFKLKADYEQKIRQSDPLYQLDVRLKRAAAAEAEHKLDLLRNPPTGAVDAVTLEKISKLSDGGRKAITETTDTITQLERIKELVANNSVIDLNNPTTEAGRLYQRLSTDVADKMARERTGAVVTKEENQNSQRILGLGFVNQVTAPPEEIQSELDFFIKKHQSAAALYDPTGDIRGFLQSQSSSEDSYLDNVDKELGGNDPMSSYLFSIGIRG